MAANESPERRHAREQRHQLNEITAELVACWRHRQDDPFAIELLRGLALAYSLDDDHPVDRRGRCKRWRCTQRRWWWPFHQRQCRARLTLNFCRSAETVLLWFRVVNRLPNLHFDFATVRDWLEECQPNKPQTDESQHEPTTMLSTVDLNPQTTPNTPNIDHTTGIE